MIDKCSTQKVESFTVPAQTKANYKIEIVIRSGALKERSYVFRRTTNRRIGSMLLKLLTSNREHSKENAKTIIRYRINPATIFICFILLLIVIFLADYSTIKAKINKDNLVKINELENLYWINHCDDKGHLPALKSHCKDWKSNIELYKKEGITILSIFIIWIIENLNHVYNILGYNLCICISIFILIIIKLI